MPSRRYSPADLATLRSNPGAVLPAPKRRSQEESLMQRRLIKWWAANCSRFGVPEICLLSIPNGGGRSGPVTGSILKAEGLRKGAPDLFLAARRLKKVPGLLGIEFDMMVGGMFIELKRRTGVVSPEQDLFHIALRESGYKVVVCRELQDAINQITTYLTK